jgi:hypothetical protein
MSEQVPDPPSVPQQHPGHGSGDRIGVLCASLCLAAAVLTMVGSFQDLAMTRQSAGGGQERITRVTVWDMTIVSDLVSQPQDSVPVNGAPLLVAVGLLLAATILRLPVARRFQRLGGVVTAGASAFLIAIVGVVGLQALWWLNIFEPDVLDERGIVPSAVQSGVGAGVWTLVAAAVLALAATVLTWRRPRPDAERVEPDTPRLGTPIVVRLPDEPPAQPPPA